MRAIAVVALAASLVLSASGLAAQAKASFAGTWTRVEDSANPSPPGGLGPSLKIDQDARTLTIARATQTGETKSVYNLDGSESKNTIGGRSGARYEAVSRTRWDGSKLVITTNLNFNGDAIETSMTMSLDAKGNLLVESPGNRTLGAAATTTKSTYKKG